MPCGEILYIFPIKIIAGNRVTVVYTVIFIIHTDESGSNGKRCCIRKSTCWQHPCFLRFTIFPMAGKTNRLIPCIGRNTIHIKRSDLIFSSIAFPRVLTAYVPICFFINRNDYIASRCRSAISSGIIAVFKLKNQLVCVICITILMFF